MGPVRAPLCRHLRGWAADRTVLAIQFGYLPGLIWIVIGVCVAGAVQDMLVLAASVRRNGRSLAEIARSDISPLAGATASITILFVVIIALSGLGLVVVKALGGEEINLAEGTKLAAPADQEIAVETSAPRPLVTLPAGTRITYPNGAEMVRSESFRVSLPAGSDDAIKASQQPGAGEAAQLTLPKGATQRVSGSSWAHSRSLARFRLRW